MRTVFILFDTLNRRSLPPYGGTGVALPNFERLAARSITFDNHHAGSLPCIPARRDMQTGRMSLLHRSWGPIEPFDNSFPEILGRQGVYSHLVTDHLQYFRDGGATYHPRYTTWEYMRGQHGDAWKAEVAPDWPALRERYHASQFSDERVRDEYHHIINRLHLRADEDYPLRQCVDAGLAFLDRNRGAQDWFLQIETFDPHEPFNAPERFRENHPTDYDGPILDWPRYARVTESPAECAELRANYNANLAFCDEELGRILDHFDAHDLWRDTALVVTTDHGYLLGEHGWWAKNRMPCYQEVAHIPLFIHHPAHAAEAGTRRQALTQTVDLMPTFLDFHGADVPPEVVAHSLSAVMADDTPVRDAALFGTFGGALNITDGRHVLMLYPEDVGVAGLFQYTVMPTTLNFLFEPDELAGADMVEPFSFTKGARVMRIPVLENSPFNPYFGPAVFFDTETALYDLAADPGQERPFRDGEIEADLKRRMAALMRELDAPREIYRRLGLAPPADAGPRPVVTPAAAP